MSRLIALPAAIAFLAALIPNARAQLTIGLAADAIEIGADFDGAAVTIFGHIPMTNEAGPPDVIAILEGDPEILSVRALSRQGLFWLPGGEPQKIAAPSLHVASSNRPIDDIAPLPLQAKLRLAPERALSGEIDPQMRDAILEKLRGEGLYARFPNETTHHGNGLFSIRLFAPSSVPARDLTVRVYVFSQGRLIGDAERRLPVRRVGVERRIHDAAMNAPAAYGMACVAMALFAGWASGLIYKK